MPVRKNFSGLAPADFKKKEKVRIIKTGKETEIERIYPMTGGYLYEVEGEMGLYGKQEIEKV